MSEAQWHLVRVEGPDPGVDTLLESHHALMSSQTPAESCHVMTGADLRAAGAQIYALRDAAGEVLAIGALKPLADGSVELKSMHTTEAARGRGLGRAVLGHLVEESRRLGAREVLLETGSGTEFAAARKLYEGAGFGYRGPFADYVEDPLSVFLSRPI